MSRSEAPLQALKDNDVPRVSYLPDNVLTPQRRRCSGWASAANRGRQQAEIRSVVRKDSAPECQSEQ